MTAFIRLQKEPHYKLSLGTPLEGTRFSPFTLKKFKRQYLLEAEIKARAAIKTSSSNIQPHILRRLNFQSTRKRSLTLEALHTSLPAFLTTNQLTKSESFFFAHALIKTLTALHLKNITADNYVLVSDKGIPKFSGVSFLADKAFTENHKQQNVNFFLSHLPHIFNSGVMPNKTHEQKKMPPIVQEILAMKKPSALGIYKKLWPTINELRQKELGYLNINHAEDETVNLQLGQLNIEIKSFDETSNKAILTGTMQQSDTQQLVQIEVFPPGSKPPPRESGLIASFYDDVYGQIYIRPIKPPSTQNNLSYSSN